MPTETANGVPVYRDSAGVLREIPPSLVPAMSTDGPVNVAVTPDLDTDGNKVPTYKSQTFTYDDSGNVSTATISDSTGTWVRTYTYQGGQLRTDSGWVKQ